MSKKKSLTKSLTFWLPELITSQWANKPEEVPIWDSSRGYPANNPPYFARDLDIDWSEEKSVVKILRKQLKNDTWQPTSPPVGKNAYPRLVKANPCEVGGEYSRDNSSFLSEFAALTGEIFARGEYNSIGKVTQNQVFNLHLKYGHLRSILEEPNHATLENWTYTSHWVNAHLEAMNVLKDEDFNSLRQHIKVKHQEWNKYFDIDLRRVKGRPRDPTGVSDLIITHGEAEFYKPQSPWWSLDIYVSKTKDEKQAQSEIAGRLIQSFSWQARTLMTIDNHDIVTRHLVPINEWLKYKLALSWLKKDDTDLKRCEECQRIYIAGKTDGKICGGTCHKRRYDKKAGSKKKS